MSNLLFDRIYRETGIRSSRALADPDPLPLTGLELPKDSIYHHFTSDESPMLPSINDVMLQGNSKVYMQSPVKLTNYPSKPILKLTTVNPLIARYHQNNKKIRRVSVVNDDIPAFSLAIVNHEWLKQTVTYKADRFQGYYRHTTLLQSLKESVTELSLKSNKNQFIHLEIPKVLPSRRSINAYIEDTGFKVLRFSGLKTLLCIELFKWINPETRKTSFIDVRYEHLHKINLILSYKGMYVILNMGFLDKIIQETNSNTDLSKGLNPLTTTDLILNKINAITSTSYPATKVSRYTYTGLLRMVDQINNGLVDTQLREFVDNGPETVIDEETLDKFTETVDDKQTPTPLDVDPGEPIEETPEVIVSSWVDTPIKPQVTLDNNTALQDRIKEAVESGNIGETAYRRQMEKSEVYRELPNPFTGEESIDEYMQVSPEMLVLDKDKINIPDSDTVVDKKQLASTLNVFDSKYITEIYRKDQLRMIDQFQAAGIIIEDYHVINKTSVIGEYEEHVLKLQPVDGNSSTIRFKVPVIKPNGTFKFNNTEYILRHQKSDLPIRKISPSRVSLSSYYGKLFVMRNEHSAYNGTTWLYNQISKKLISDPDKIFTDEVNGYDHYLNVARSYNQLAQNFSYIKYVKGDLTFDIYLDTDKRTDNVPEGKTLKEMETNGDLFIGYVNKTGLLYVRNNGTGEYYYLENEEDHSIGNVFDLLELDASKYPKEEALIKILGVRVPIIFVLSYLNGLRDTLKSLKVKHTLHTLKQRPKVEKGEKLLTFKDGYILFTLDNTQSSLLVNPLIKQRAYFKTVKLKEVNDKGLYYALIEMSGGNTSTIKEIELINRLFIDPITKDVLKEIKEPTVFIGLLERSVTLISTEDYPATTDTRYMRFRGYERINGIIYKEMVNSIRAYERRTVRSRMKMEMNPHAVWTTIDQDPTKKFTEGTNPIQSLKEKESVTMTGYDGRGKVSMTKPTRIYHQSDLGVTSEATPDSGEVGVSTYLSANPQFDNVRGISKSYDFNEDVDSTKLLSTSALLSACANKDDPKRLTSLYCN